MPMATTRIIWGKWDCRECGTKGISAQPPAGETQPRCSGCGSPREQAAGEAAYLDNARDPATGRVLNAVEAKTADEIAVATAGADWACAFCKRDKRARFTTCQACGAPRSGIQSPVAAIPAKRVNSGFNFVYVVFGFVVLAALVMAGSILYDGWAAQTRPEGATVAAASWTHTSNLQRYTPVDRDGWQSDLGAVAAIMPVNGTGESAGVENIRNCRESFHHNNRIACGTERECREVPRTVNDGETCSERCTTSDNGNGSFSETCDQVCSPNSRTEYRTECTDVTKYCDEPVYATKCDYSTWEWSPLDSRVATGEGAELNEWPVFADLGPLDRVQQVATFSVSLSMVVDGVEKRGATAPRDAEQYAAYLATGRATVNVPNVGEPEFQWAEPGL